MLEAAFVLGVITVTDPGWPKLLTGQLLGRGVVQTAVPWDPRPAFWGNAGVGTTPGAAAAWLAGPLPWRPAGGPWVGVSQQHWTLGWHLQVGCPPHPCPPHAGSGPALSEKGAHWCRSHWPPVALPIYIKA